MRQIAVFINQTAAHAAGSTVADGEHFNVFPKFERRQLVGFICMVKHRGDTFYRPIME